MYTPEYDRLNSNIQVYAIINTLTWKYNQKRQKTGQKNDNVNFVAYQFFLYYRNTAQAILNVSYATHFCSYIEDHMHVFYSLQSYAGYDIFLQVCKKKKV